MYEKLVRLLKDKAERFDYDGWVDTAVVMRRAADAIEDLENKLNLWRQGKISRWVSVTERLPKYGDWVLGIGPKKGYHVCEYRGITHFPYSGDIPWFSAKGRSLNITHWMPLPPAPEPPKEET